MEQRRIPSSGGSRPLTAGASHLGTCSDMPRWWWYLRYLFGLTSHTRSVLQMEGLPEGRSVMKQGMLSPGCTTPDSGAICNIWKKRNPRSHRGAVSLSWTLLYAISLEEKTRLWESPPHLWERCSWYIQRMIMADRVLSLTIKSCGSRFTYPHWSLQIPSSEFLSFPFYPNPCLHFPLHYPFISQFPRIFFECLVENKFVRSFHGTTEMGEKAAEERGLTLFSLQVLICQANTTDLLSEILFRKTSRRALVQSGIFPKQILWCDKVATWRKPGETRRNSKEIKWDTAIGEKWSHSHPEAIQKLIHNICQLLLPNNLRECHIYLIFALVAITLYSKRTVLLQWDWVSNE